MTRCIFFCKVSEDELHFLCECSTPLHPHDGSEGQCKCLSGLINAGQNSVGQRVHGNWVPRGLANVLGDRLITIGEIDDEGLAFGLWLAPL